MPSATTRISSVSRRLTWRIPFLSCVSSESSSRTGDTFLDSYLLGFGTLGDLGDSALLEL
jgi:hypothetical protein